MLFSSWAHSVGSPSHSHPIPLNDSLLEMADIQQLLHLIDPTSFVYESDIHIDEGLLQMKLDEPVKLQLCFVLQHLCNYQLQYRIESAIAFSEDFVGRLQSVRLILWFILEMDFGAILGSKTAV